MSNQTKLELKISALTILLSIAGSVGATIWWAATIQNQILANAEEIRIIHGKIEKITEIIIKEK